MRYILYLSFLCICTLCEAQRQVSLQDSIHEIDEVLVTARSVATPLSPVQQLSGQRLVELSVHSVADALRYFSGLQIKDYGGVGGLKTVDVRSLGSQHLGVFYNGVQLGNAQNGVVDLGRFSLDNMELIRLYNGEKTSLLQSARDYASSNTLHLQSRRPQFLVGERKKLHLALDAGSFLTINPKISYEHKLGETSAASASGEVMYSSGRYPFRYKKAGGYDVLATRENGDISALRAELAWWGRVNASDLSLQAYLYRSSRGYPGASVREEPGVFKHQDRQWDSNLFLQGSFKNVGNRYSIRALWKYAYDYLRYLSDPRLDVTTMHVDNHYHQQEVYLSLSQSLMLNPGLSISLSNDVQYNHLRANLPEFARPERLQILSAIASSYNNKYLRAHGSILHTYTLDLRQSEPRPEAFRLLSPSFHLAYYPWGREGVSLRAFYKHSYRLPSFMDLYYDFIGGTRLNPERTEQFNLGLVYKSRVGQSTKFSYELQADAYYNRVKDKIVAMPTSNQFRWSMLNYGLVDVLGLDIHAMGTYIHGDLTLTPRITYTYQQALDHTDPSSPWYGGQISYAPRHSASLTLRAAYRRWSMNYSFLYTGERYHSVANIPEYHVQPWYTHDLSLSRSWPLPHSKDLRTTLAINNLFNQQYEVVRNYPMPGINFQIKLQLYV
ncbi:MAG: TonB-dependent receptor [Porphyromonadaceae bacterium]|nr:TonB-dependent receptor [Porphyromonadaceae bacterium]